MKKIVNNKGFTLFELIIVVVIIGIMASIAYPSYMDYVKKSRRSDAKAGLLSLQQAQEKFRANCTEYADNIVTSGNYVCNSGTSTFSVEHNATSPDLHYLHHHCKIKTLLKQQDFVLLGHTFMLSCVSQI